MYCQQCGKEISETAIFCPNCGTKKNDVPSKKAISFKETTNNDNLLQCPKCRSTQLTDGKKGFSGGKAVAGAVLTGGIGILAGTIGSNKTIITCLNCGKKFKPGEDYENARKKKIAEEKAQQEAMKSPVYWILMIIMMGSFIWLVSKCV